MDPRTEGDGELVDLRTEGDGELVTRARRGEVAAFERIVERYRRPLVALAAARLGSMAEAEDVAQEALVRAFFRLHQLRRPEALGSWLRRMTERLALRRSRRRREELLALEEWQRLARPTAPPSDAAGMLDRLPEAMRRTVALTYLAGYTCRETAALLGVQEGTVKSRLSRARAILKEAVEMPEEMEGAKPAEQFTQETMDRLMREARRLLQQGQLEEAAARTDRVLEAQARAYFAAGDPPGFRFDQEAARISGLALKERRRRDCEANAAQYGYRLEDLDWELAEVNVLAETVGRPAGRGADVWGVPLTKTTASMLDARDICRRLRCSPLLLRQWVQRGCPTIKCWPFVRFDLDRVKQWLKDNGVSGWPEADDADTDRPIRVLLRAVHEHKVTPEEALRIVDELDL
jgi:RNA polymerase sigma-70 factor (ECF subfamily)